jgi:hypothetical protein
MRTNAIHMTAVTKTAAPTDALNPKESVAAQGLSSFAFVAGPHSARRAPSDHRTADHPCVRPPTHLCDLSATIRSHEVRLPAQRSPSELRLSVRVLGPNAVRRRGPCHLGATYCTLWIGISSGSCGPSGRDTLTVYQSTSAPPPRAAHRVRR